ncbi:MAG: ROK family protein [Bacteroidota bacterium]
MKQAVIGIDIGGTFTKYGIVDKEGRSYGEDKLHTDKHADINDYLKELFDGVEKLQSGIQSDLEIKGIGIGAPNGNYYRGTIEQAPNLRWKGTVHLTDLMKEHYNLPVVLTNDANAAALGEMIFGAAKNMREFIVITLGTGLGSGIVVNGEVVYGHDGFAGELGHTIVKLQGRQCGCGRRGCLETYVSATGIKRTVFKLLSEYTGKSELRTYSFDDLEASMISKLANEGDPIALRAFDFTAEILASKLADAVAHTSPEAIFLFGGLANAGDLLFVPVRKHFEERLLKIYTGKIKILPSGLKDKNAAIMGASALIWNELSR